MLTNNPVFEHMAQTHASRFTTSNLLGIQLRSNLLGIQQRASPVRDDNYHFANARISLISEANLVDAPLLRNEKTRRNELFRLGVEKATSSDCKTVFPSQTTQVH